MRTDSVTNDSNSNWCLVSTCPVRQRTCIIRSLDYYNSPAKCVLCCHFVVEENEDQGG